MRYIFPLQIWSNNLDKLNKIFQERIFFIVCAYTVKIMHFNLCQTGIFRFHIKNLCLVLNYVRFSFGRFESSACPEASWNWRRCAISNSNGSRASSVGSRRAFEISRFRLHECFDNTRGNIYFFDPQWRRRIIVIRPDNYVNSSANSILVITTRRTNGNWETRSSNGVARGGLGG